MATAPAAMPHGSRIRQIGWMLALSLCMATFLALTFKVNAVKSDVRLAEREIIALEQEKLMLETEFQTRASQRQLSAWNAVEFGYVAPRADQYLESERDLAALGLPRGVGAPEPIRVARAQPDASTSDSIFADWMADKDDAPATSEDDGDPETYESGGGSLAQRLARSPAIPAALAEAGQ